MSEHRNLPPRPRRIPPHILRRRRIVAVIILLVILSLIVWGIIALVGLFTGDDESTPTPAPTVTETASPSPSPSASPSEDATQAVDACDPEFLVLEGATDEESYAPDELPVFTMTISHEGDVVCDASVGSDEQNFVVENAAGEFVFSTRACQVDPQEQIVEMEPGQSESASFEWERIGTDENCEMIVEDLNPGEYQLVVSLGELSAEPVEFELEES